jgi:hypothetical protein
MQALLDDPGFLPRTELPREKGVISLRMGTGVNHFFLSISLTEKYRYGSDDLIDLAKAEDIFRRVGGKEVREACNNPNGISIVPRHTPWSAKTPYVPAEVKTHLCADILPYAPTSIKLLGERESAPRHAEAFLESGRWLRVDDPKKSAGGEVEVLHDEEEQLLECARLLSHDSDVISCVVALTAVIALPRSTLLLTVPESSEAGSTFRDCTDPVCSQLRCSCFVRSDGSREDRPSSSQHLPRNVSPSSNSTSVCPSR